jgi:hypothetical protein
MKKGLTLLACVLMAVSLYAQNVSFGPKAGLNIISIGKTEFETNAFSLGAHYGGFVEYHFNDYFSLSADVLVSKKRRNYVTYENQSLVKAISGGLFGAVVEDSLLQMITDFVNDTVYGTRKGTTSFSYVEIPLMANFKYKNLSVGAGPYFAYMAKANTVEQFTQESALLDIGLDLIDSIQYVGPFLKATLLSQFPGYEKPLITESTSKSAFRTFDIGFNADVRYTTESNFFFGVRYSRGFLNHRQTKLKDKDVHSLVMITLGYTFGKRYSEKPKAIYDLEQK